MKKALLCAAIALACAPSAVQAQESSSQQGQSQGQQQNPPPPAQTQNPPPIQLEAPKKATDQPPVKPPAKAPAKAPAAPRVKGDTSVVVEEIVARVNNEIITTSDYNRAKDQVPQDVRDECQNCSGEQFNNAVELKQKDLLRDLIDQSLLSQRGKDLGYNVEAEVIKRLDQIRIQNNLPSMEELEKAIESQGISFEDYKNQIRKNILTERVIRQEVQSDIMPTRDEIQKYYKDHPEEFTRPEMVYLREIFVNTDGKTDAEKPDLKKKAETLLARVKAGDDFGELAKHFSDGQTAQQGGELGGFKKGDLDPKLEASVFKLNRNELTDVIETSKGYMVLQVEMRYEAGLQPFDKVEPEVTNRLVMDKTEPKLRQYLKTLREESYVTVQPGYVDTAAVPTGATIEEVAASPDSGKVSAKAPKDKKSKKSGS